jgi:hypothetical protein
MFISCLSIKWLSFLTQVPACLYLVLDLHWKHTLTIIIVKSNNVRYLVTLVLFLIASRIYEHQYVFFWSNFHTLLGFVIVADFQYLMISISIWCNIYAIFVLIILLVIQQSIICLLSLLRWILYHGILKVIILLFLIIIYILFICRLLYPRFGFLYVIQEE